MSRCRAAELAGPGRALNRLAPGAAPRALGSEAAGRLKPGEAIELAFPAGSAAEALHLVHLPRRAAVFEARKAGATLARAPGKPDLLVIAEADPMAAEIAFGLALRAYAFTPHKSTPAEPRGAVVMAVARPEAAAARRPTAAAAEGVFFTRDLVTNWRTSAHHA